MTGRGRWSEHTINLLKRYYGRRPATWIASHIGRTVECVHRQAVKQFTTRAVEWSALDDSIVRAGLMRRASRLEIARRLVVSQEELDRRVEALRSAALDGPLRREHEEDFKRCYPSVLDSDLIAVFAITQVNIEEAAQRFQLRKSKGMLAPLGLVTVMPRWTPSELTLLKREYAGTANVSIAKMLGRSVKSVVSKAHHLGLKKSEERLRSMGAENVRRRYEHGA